MNTLSPELTAFESFRYALQSGLANMQVLFSLVKLLITANGIGNICQKDARIANKVVKVVPKSNVLLCLIIDKNFSAEIAIMGVNSNNDVNIYLGAITDGLNITQDKIPIKPAKSTAKILLSIHELGFFKQNKKGIKAINRKDKPPPCIG